MTDQQLKVLAEKVLVSDAMIAAQSRVLMNLIEALLPHLPADWASSRSLSDREQFAASLIDPKLDERRLELRRYLGLDS